MSYRGGDTPGNGPLQKKCMQDKVRLSLLPRRNYSICVLRVARLGLHSGNPVCSRLLRIFMYLLYCDNNQILWRDIVSERWEFTQNNCDIVYQREKEVCK